MNRGTVLATIITIGDELLIGQTIDTNSAWMAQELNKIGIWVHRRIAIGDVWKDIWQSLDEESKLSDIILITGGLGPTADDITKPLLCQYFDGKMVVNEEALANVKNIFENILKRPLIERNLKQAEVPDVCTVIPNKRGTAPGMWFEKNGKYFVSMPGVPHEMKGMMHYSVLPMLQKKFTMAPIIHRTLLTAGIGESFLAERIQEFEKNLPSNIKLAYLPSLGSVRLRLTGKYADGEQLKETLNHYIALMTRELGELIYGYNDLSLEAHLMELLGSKGLWLGTAESCTGGYLAHRITSVAGSSSYFKGGYIPYSNECKTKWLGVAQELIVNHGAVSQ